MRAMVFVTPGTPLEQIARGGKADDFIAEEWDAGLRQTRPMR